MRTEKTTILPRRRLLKMLAASTLLPLCTGTPLAAQATTPSVQPIHWNGYLLGADSQLTIYHPDRQHGELLLQDAIREAQRLEKIFSLYLPNSEISHLNRQGFLASPSPDFVDLSQFAKSICAATDGKFDITIQPLWAFLKNHFHRNPASIAPATLELEQIAQRIDWQAYTLTKERISFGKPQMALTLNGIAQGYITDKVAAILRQGGLKHVLIDMGEHRAIGQHPDGRPWTIGVLNPEQPYEISRHIPLQDHAMATSGGYGMTFDKAGNWHHILDPLNHRSSNLYRSVTVIAATATKADGWSTAFTLLSPDAIQQHINRERDMRVLVTYKNGAQQWFSPRAFT
ncbi:MAG: thiamine biosynthesis protein ApbE [Kordiimonas sp.]|nr:thiamine biosynthesis protein ApbE [Kordiimonas sp.]